MIKSQLGCKCKPLWFEGFQNTIQIQGTSNSSWVLEMNPMAVNTMSRVQSRFILIQEGGYNYYY